MRSVRRERHHLIYALHEVSRPNRPASTAAFKVARAALQAHLKHSREHSPAPLRRREDTVHGLERSPSMRLFAEHRFGRLREMALQSPRAPQARCGDRHPANFRVGDQRFSALRRAAAKLRGESIAAFSAERVQTAGEPRLRRVLDEACACTSAIMPVPITANPMESFMEKALFLLSSFFLFFPLSPLPSYPFTPSTFSTSSSNPPTPFPFQFRTQPNKLHFTHHIAFAPSHP